VPRGRADRERGVPRQRRPERPPVLGRRAGLRLRCERSSGSWLDRVDTRPSVLFTPSARAPSRASARRPPPRP
jgi:hypothetical protein